jgi:transposase
MRKISEETSNNIMALLSQGLSLRETAERVGVGYGTVQKVRNQHPQPHQLSKKGRPKKLTDQNKRHCVRSITSGRMGTATSVARKLQEDLGVSVSRITVSRALKEAGMSSAEKVEKPRLSVENVKARFSFAERHKDWTIDDWKRVIWSDESRINRFCSDGRSWYWARDGVSQQEGHVKQKMKYGGGSIMIWGCMTWYGTGYMCKIEGRMDQHLYKSILEDELMKTIEYYQLDPSRCIFQQDNDPKHRSKSVQQWITDQSFEVLEWPPQSPDLNPIEHLWSHLKRQLNTYESVPKGMLELWERVECEWNKIDPEVCMNLIKTMPRRIDAVLQAKGRWTKY